MTRLERLGLTVCALGIALLILIALMAPRRRPEASALATDRIDTIHVAAPAASGAMSKPKKPNKHKTPQKPLPQRNPLDETF